MNKKRADEISIGEHIEIALPECSPDYFPDEMSPQDCFPDLMRIDKIREDGGRIIFLAEWEEFSSPLPNAELIGKRECIIRECSPDEILRAYGDSDIEEIEWERNQYLKNQ